MSKSHKIRLLKAARPDLRNAEIAKAVECSAANVTQVLRRVPAIVRTAYNCLSPEEVNFVRLKARKHNLKPVQMAVFLLRDAINEAREDAR